MTFKEDYPMWIKDRTYSDGFCVFRARDFGSRKEPVTRESFVADIYFLKGDRKGTYERRRLFLDECEEGIPATEEEIALLNEQIRRYSSK